MSAEKKGMPVWGWVLLGCGGIMALGAVIVIGLGMFAVKKGKKFIEEVERNPAHTAARIIAMADKNIEIVDSNDEDQTVTLKNKESGEEVTLDLTGIHEGRVSWINDGKKGVLNVTAENGINITDDGPDGQRSVTLGSGSKPPDWLPAYPGSESHSIAQFNGDNEGESGSYGFSTDDDAETVQAFFKKTLQDEGYEVKTANYNEESFTVNGTRDGITISATFGKDKKNGNTNGMVQYSKKP